MLNLKRTSTVVALATGLSVAAVSPALAEDRQESDSQQRAEIVRDVQDNADGNDLFGDNELVDLTDLFGIGGDNRVLEDLGNGDTGLGNGSGNGDTELGNGSGNGNLGGNDLGGVGNGNHTDTGDNDVNVDPHVEPQIDPEVGSGDNDVQVDPDADPQVDGSGDTDVVDDDSRTSDRESSDDDRTGDRERSGDEEDGLLGGLL